MLKRLKNLQGLDGKGRIIIVAHSFSPWKEDEGYGVWVLCENYAAGKIHKSWRYVTHRQTKEQAIAEFNKKNKAERF